MKTFIKEHGGVVISSLVVVLLIAVCTVIKPLAAESQESFVGRFSDYASEQIDETIVDWELSNQETSDVMLKRVKLATTNNKKARFDYTISLEDSLRVIYHVKNLTDDNLENYEVTYVNPETGSQVTVHPTSTIVNTYIIGEAIPMNMMDKYKIIVKYKGQQINPESEVSIKDYCGKAINGNYPENLKKLCKATLNYGSISEIYFNGKKYNGGTYQYDLSNLPNSDIDTSLNDVEKPASNGLRYDGDLGGKVTNVKSTIVIGTETSIKYYIYVDSLDLNETTIECLNGKPTTNLTKESGGRYSFKIENINALELGEDFIVNIKEGTEQITITYSVYDFAASKWDAGNDLANLCKKLVTYGEAAREYANITK